MPLSPPTAKRTGSGALLPNTSNVVMSLWDEREERVREEGGGLDDDDGEHHSTCARPVAVPSQCHLLRALLPCASALTLV